MHQKLQKCRLPPPAVLSCRRFRDLRLFSTIHGFLPRSSVPTAEGRRSPDLPAAAYNRAVRSLLRILLPALAILAPMIASPAAASYAETRVWGFELKEPARARAQPTLSETCIEGYPPAYGGLVVGCSPVPRETAGDFQYNMVENPGPLASMRGRPAGNFAGGRYNATTLTEELVLYRGGDGGRGRNAFGQWFTREPPRSQAHVRIDSAVKRDWTDASTGVRTNKSPVNAVYGLRIPKGTTIYEGPVGSQGGVYVGGGNQIFVPKPWNSTG